MRIQPPRAGEARALRAYWERLLLLLKLRVPAANGKGLITASPVRSPFTTVGDRIERFRVGAPAARTSSRRLNRVAGCHTHRHGHASCRAERVDADRATSSTRFASI